MKLSFSPEDEQFREEIAGWLKDNLTGEFEKLQFRGGPGDALPGEVARTNRRWRRKLSSKGT